MRGSIEATITLTGSNFVFTSTADWNGTPIATSYINPTTLVAQLPAVDLKSVGNGTITVSNPSPGGGTSTGLNMDERSRKNIAFLKTVKRSVHFLRGDFLSTPLIVDGI